MNRCCSVWILLFLFLGALSIGFIGESQDDFSSITGNTYKTLTKKQFNQAYQKTETRLDRFRTPEQKRAKAPLCDRSFQPTNKLVPKRYCDCLADKKSKEYCETTFLRGAPGSKK